MAKPTRKTIRKRVATRRRNLRKCRNSPTGRLEADGASKSRHMGRRLSWLVQEWQLPACPPIGRAITEKVHDYMKTHGVSYDWLLAGDLKGLQRMMQQRRMGKAAATPESLKEKIARLSESEREVIRKMVDHLVEGASRSAGADRTGTVIGSGWRAIAEGCGDKSLGRPGGPPFASLGRFTICIPRLCFGGLCHATSPIRFL
jgi:hypothetical protein